MYLDAIDHVQLAMPPGGEELATWFYEEILGVPRVAKPPELAIRGGCWFERGSLRIHLGVQDDFVAATKAHPAFAVSDLDALVASVEAAGIAVRRPESPVASEGPQAYVDDPFGNRLEFRPGRPTGDVPDYAEVVNSVAADAGNERFAAQVAFITELDRLKTVQRQSFILGGDRRENTAEHSWHVAMLARVLAEYADPDVDIDRVVAMLLVHDIVEIDAGDTGIYDTSYTVSKEDREQAAAQRLFGMLPPDIGDRLRADWQEYETGTTADARFARVFDRLSPFLLNLTANGVSWTRWHVHAGRVRSVMKPVAEGAPDLGAFVSSMIDRAVADGLLTRESPLLD